MNIKSSTSKFMTLFVTLTVMLCSVIAPESHAQSSGYNAGQPTGAALTPQLAKPANGSQDINAETRKAIFNTLKHTTDHIWFEKNAGQFNNPDVLYGFRTGFGSMAIYNNKLRIVTKQREPFAPEDEEKEDEENELSLHIVDITFPGSNHTWTVEPGEKSSVIGSYYRTPDKNEKPIVPVIYKEVTLKNVYPGIDLRLYSNKEGALEFDWLVSKASDYDKIKINYNGQDGIKVADNGEMTLKLRYQDMKIVLPETYQVIDGNKTILKSRMEKMADGKTLCYKVLGDINPDMPLVIDPVMIWSTYMNDGLGSGFDEYLYTIASNPAGDVYCAGQTNEPMSVAYLSNVSAGYSNTFSGMPGTNGTPGNVATNTVLYEFNPSGTAILAWTMTGAPSGSYASPTVVPSSMGIFPDGRILLCYAATELVQVFSNTLAARIYSGSANPASPPSNLNYNAVRVLNDSIFYISGSTTTAYPSIVPANAPDPTFAGPSEGMIMCIKGIQNATPTSLWATYVGGNNAETFCAIALSTDNTKLAFVAHSIVGTGYPATVNPVDNTPGAAGTTELLIGVLPATMTQPTAFSMFSYLGGSGDEGNASTTYPSDKGVVCADNNYFYIGGNTLSTDLPGTTGAAQATLKGGVDQFVSRVPWNGSAGTGFASTYNGGSSDDLVGGIAVDFRTSNVLLFGSTSSSDYPVNQTSPASPYYQSLYQNGYGTANGTLDISYTSFNNTLTTRTFGTYIGGAFNDYFGSTGKLRGTGHLFYNLTNGLVYIGTTIHSDQTTVPAQWITDIPGFDKTTDPAQTWKDNHFIFEWDPNTYDYGDAPASYDGLSPARSALSDKIRLGLLIDAETAPYNSYDALGDDTTNLADEDGVTKPLPMLTTGVTTYSLSVSVYNNTGSPITLAGWLDANANHLFDNTEYTTMSIPTSTSQQTVTLTWTGLVPLVYGTGQTFVRLRLTDGPVTAFSDTGEIQAGEVEDYQVCIKPNAGPNQTICIIGSATMAATGAGTWTAQSNNPGTSTIASPTSPTTSISGFSAVGTYNYIWTNSTGCSDTASIVVTAQPGSVTITPSTANICAGESVTLTASATPAGGVYQWSPLLYMTPSNGTSASVTVTPPATQTYSVVYNLSGCTSGGSRAVTVYPVVGAHAGGNQTYCSNVSTTITLGGSPTATGGSGSFTYAWSPATRLSSTTVANPTITSIVASTTTYYVTVTDQVTGCTSVDSMVLTINPSTSVSIAISDTNLCLGQSTPLNATGLPAGGSYTWSPTVGMSPAAGNVADVTVSPSANQTYVVAYSLNGCAASASRTINVYPDLLAHAGGNQTFCLPVSGTITLGGSPTATGGSGSFSYAWSPSTNLSSVSVANPTIITPVATHTTYYLTVTDTKSGCTSTDSMVLIVNSKATVTISSADTNLCTGQSAVLIASGSPSGGSYQWAPLGTLSPAAGNTATVTATPGSTQSYVVTYTASGCSGTASKTVNVVPTVFAHAGGNQTFCMPVGSTITLGGSPTATGGSGSFSYAWSPATRLSSSSVANPTITSVVASAITYHVTVTDNVSGCSSVDSMILTINPAVTANAGTDTSVCLNSGVIIGGSPTGSGGTGTLTYAWAPTTGLNSFTISNPKASPVANTTYSVTVSDSKGCSASSSILVTVNPLPTANAGANQVLTACSAASVTIGGSPTGSGGTGSLSYNWSPSGGLDSTDVSNPTVSHLGSNTLYTVVVTDSKGCTAQSSVDVNVASSTLSVDAGVGGSYCAGSGGSVTLTGSVTGGTGPYIYAWSPSSSVSPSNALTTVASPSIAGSYLYTLNVTDTNGCNASDTVRVNVWPAVVADAGPNVAVCSGFGDTIGGHPTASAGSGGYLYSWSPGTGLNSTSVANPFATPATSTPYSVTVTDINNCTASSTATVTVNSNPVAHAGTNQTFCQPVTSTVVLGASPSATGGSGKYIYTWSPSTNLSDSASANPTVTVNGASSIEYILTVTDAVTGCTSVDSTHLTILAQPTVTISSADTNICNGNSAILTASGSPAGGTYQWAPLVNIAPGAGNTATVTVTPSHNQTYQVIYTQNTCTDTAYKNIVVYSPIVASAGPNQTYCLPVTSTITIGGNPTASGGSGSYSYHWAPISNLSSIIVANPTITSIVAGTTTYVVTVTDNLTGCTSVDSMVLTINPVATVSITAADTNICSGQSTTLIAIGSPAGGTYQWSPTFNMNPGAGDSATVIVAPSGTQSYQVTYKASGCSGSAATTVHVYPAIVAEAGPDEAFCLPYSGTITIGGSPTASSGSGNYSYRWSPTTNLSDSTVANPSVSKVNSSIQYYVTVTDNVTGCTSVDSMHLSVNTHATVSIASTDTNICFGQSTTLTAVVNPTGGTFQWTPIVYLNPGTGTTQSVTVHPVNNQLYQVVYFRNGCDDTAYQNVNVYPVVVANAGGNQTYCMPVSGTVTLGGAHTASGGSGSYIYAWSPSTNLNDSALANPSLDSIVANTTTYYLTVTDAVTGCTATDSMVLTISAKTTVSVFSPQTNICLGSLATLTATGSPAGGSYQWNPIVAMIPPAGNTATVQVSPSSGFQTYFVYYDLNGCKDTASILINTYTQPVANAGGNQSYCLPVTTPVTIGKTATGGSGNYTYRWSPGTYLSDSTIASPIVDSVNTPGSVTYIVTVTDNITGCVGVDSMTLTLDAKSVVSIAPTDTNLCAGQCTILTATGSPAGGTYQWAPLGTITPPAGNTASVTACPAGIGAQTYQIVYGTSIITFINDDNNTIETVSGCYDTAYQTIHVYPTVVAHAGGNQTFCLPLSDTVRLGATPAATGGSGSFTYAWSPGTNLNDSTLANPVYTGSTAVTVTYHLLVTDNLTKCTGEDSMVLTLNPKPTVTISATDTNLCAGQCTSLTASGTPSGGTYQWAPLGTITPPAGNTASVTACPSGIGGQTYQLVYDAKGCYDTSYQTIHVYPAVVAHGGGPKTFCSPVDTVTLGGTPTATGGSGHYRYSWTPAATLNDSALANPTATPTGNITYHVTVTDSVTGCSSTDSVVVTRNPGPQVFISPSVSICSGGSVVISASGGGSYVWSNGSHTCCPTVTPSATTIYTVTVTDANGCTASASDTVTVGSTLVFTIPSISFCDGGGGILTPSLLGPNYRYAWSPGTGLSCVSCATPAASPATSTIYNLVITDTVNGCSGSDTVLVTVHPKPVADFFAPQSCYGDSVQFVDHSSSTDPIASWFYNFGDSTLTSDTSDLRNPYYTYVTSGSHDAYQIVTTIYGCADSFNLPVISRPPLVIATGQNDTIPYGSSVVLGASGGSSYLWSPTATLINANTANPTASPLVTTTYFVTVTDVNGCTGVDSVTVVVVQLPNVSAGPDTFVCVGNSVPLLGSSSTPGVTFQWFPSTYLDTPSKAQPIATPTTPGQYQYVLVVTETVGTVHVTNRDTMVLTVDPLPQITATPDSVNVCGSPINVTFNSSLASTTYKWYGSNGTSGTGNISTFISNTTTHDSAVIYTVIGTAPGGCTDTILVPAIAHPVPILTASGFPTQMCSGTYYTGTVVSNTPGTTITWSSTLGPNGTGGNINQLFNNAGTIPDTVIVSFVGTTSSCTSDVLQDTVIVYPLPHANAGPNQVIISCSSDSIQLGGTPTATFGTPGYTYLWSPLLGGINDTLSNPYIKQLGANATFTVTVTDSKGCTASSQMNVTVQPPTLAVTISASGPTTWCEGTSGSVDLTVNISGGNPLYSFAWSPTTALSDSNAQVTTASPGVAGVYPYTVVVTDHNGCQASATRTVTVKPEPHPVITGLDSDYCANVGSVPLTASIPGGTWSGSGIVGSTFRPSLFGPGVYTVTYTVTSGGCTNDTFQNVTVDSLPVVTISGNSANYCSAAPSATFVGSPAGGTWSGPGINPSTGVFNPSLITIPNGISTTVTVTYHYSSPAGCTDSASTSVTINESPTLSISLSADTICQNQTLTLTPHFNTSPLFTNIQWFSTNGTFITNSINAITVNPTLQVYGFYGVITTTQGCTASDTVFVHVNESPYAAADYDTLCGVTSSLINVLANDTDPENNAEVLSIVTGPHHGSASVSSNEILYDVAYGYFGYDTLTYRICNSQCLHDCDTANVYLSICPRNLPPTADTIVYTQLITVPQDVNVSLATSDPNGDPLHISMVGDSTDGGNVTVVNTGNGAYTITGDSLGTFVITYQVCDTDQYPIHVLCDTSVIIAHIIPPTPTDTLDQPPVANNDFATTSGTTPAVVNVRGNDYSDPTSDGLTKPTLISSTTTADGSWSVNTNGNVVFTPNAGLAPGIYYDTVHYQVCDPVDTLCATAYVVVTTNEIDTPIANRPPVAVNDHETIPENTTGSFNVKSNDSDPDGNPLTIPTIVTGPTDGTIVSVGDNGTIIYTPRPGTHSVNGQPTDSFEYYICDSLAAHLPRPLCDSAEVYIYVVPRNLPPTADTIVYTQLVTVPQDVNVSLATSDPNGDPLTISLIGDSTDGGNVTVVKNGNGSYTITGDSLGTFVIHYQVCDTDQYPIHVLCDTSVIIAHIVPPGPDTLNQPPVANNDFATTSGTAPAVVNVRGNDYSNPTSDGLTIPTLISSTTTADGTWTVDGNGNVIFTPNAGLAPGIYYDTVHYQVCDPVDGKCATAYVVVTTNEIDTPIANRPPVAVNDHETVPQNTTSSFNVKANDSDPDGNPLTIPTIVDSSVNGDIVSVGDNGTVLYRPNPGVHSINGQPVDSFRYYICDSLAAHLPRPLCDSAEVYIYVVPANLPPTADTIRYTQLDSVPQDVNVSLATSDPNGDPLTISIVSNPNPSITIVNTGNGSYTITGADTGYYVITYQVCDTDPYPIHVLCDTSVIIAHIISPLDTLTPQPPVANNDFATTSGTAPATVNVRGNDYSVPGSDGLTVPTLISSTTTTDGHWTVNGSGDVIFTPNAGLAPGIYYDTVYYQVCDPVNGLCATAYVVVTTNEIDTPIYNRPPVAVNDHETIPENTTSSFNVKANDSDPDGDSLTIPTIVTGPTDGTIVSVGDNGTVIYTPRPGAHSINGQPVDSFRYYICDTLAAHLPRPLCDSAEVYIYVVPANLPPTADTIRYTQYDSVPQDVNVSLSVSDPNGDPLNISMVGDSTDGGVLIVTNTGNGAYTITGNDTGYYVITYQVCDTDPYPIHVLCDTSVIIAHIITKTPNTVTPQPPIANNDFATTSGTAPATVNVRGNDYSNPNSDGLTVPTLISSTTTTDGHWTVNGSGDVIFTPNAGLAPGIYYDTVYYRVCDLVNGLCATAYVVVTTNEIDTPIYNRPPVAVNDHETVPENTTGSFNVKANDSDPDGDSLTIPTIIAGSGPHNGTIVSVGDNGTIIYKPNPDIHSINGQPVDSFEYYICDTLAAHTPRPLCDSAEVYIYVTPMNLPPTADTIRYTQLDSIPQDVNVSLSVSDPNGDPLTISIVSNPNPTITIVNTSGGAYTITGTDTGYYVITYQVCDTDPYPIHVLCDTSVIIAHIISPVDTLTPQPPVANNDFATTSGTTPAVVNVRGNDYSVPGSDGLTVPTLISSTTTADGTWSVNANGNVVFTPNAGLAQGIYYDTVYYRVCDLVNGLCATAYVVVTTNEIDTPIANRPPVAVDDHETVPANTPSSFNVKANDSDPDGNPLTIPTIVTGPVNGRIISVGDNGTVIYVSDTNVHSRNSHVPIDSFRYYICDTLAAHTPRPLCDSAEVYIYIPQILFAVNDTDTTGCSTPVVICVKHNDYSIGGDSFIVKGISIPPTHGTATLDTTTQCITYVPDGSGSRIDSFRYYDEDLLGNTDSAWVYVNVVCCSIHAANDTLSINFGDSIYADVLVNSTYNHNFPYTLTILPGSGPANGSAHVVNNDSILYVPNPGSCGADQFKYVLADICGTDTGIVSVNVKCDSNCHKPLAVNDTVAHGYVCADTINVLIRDTFGTGPVITVIKGPLYGTDTVINNNIVYIPDGTHPSTQDSLVYSLCNICNKCDTAVVFINLSQFPCNVYYPIVNKIVDSICKNTTLTINALAQDSDPNGETLYISQVISGNHGTAADQGDTLILYHPNANYVGMDTLTYRVCNTGVPNLCNTNQIYINVLPCLPPPIVIDTLIYDTTTVCTPKMFCIDSIYQPGTHFVQFVGFCDSASHGTVILSSDTVLADSATMLCFTYTPNCDTIAGGTAFVGNDTVCLVICDIGTDTVCTSTHVVITVLPKPSVDSIWTHTIVTYICDAPDTIHVLDNAGFLPNPGNTQTGTAIRVFSVGAAAGQAPFSGTVSIGAGDSTVIYIPNAGFVGYDTFQYVITNNGTIQLFDTGIVYVYVCRPPVPIAVNYNPGCLDTTGYVDQPTTINILSIDTLYPATDTAIVLIDTSDTHANGKLVVNPDFSVTFTPDSGKRGSFTFTYQVLEFVGGVIGYSDTASVCIDIVDTAAQCTFPNGFSPNNDGYNDVFMFPCADIYPNGTMEVFNRWGDPIWQSKGPFTGWDGSNQQGHQVPDGTYYFVYKYNDGSGRSVARFVVVHR